MSDDPIEDRLAQIEERVGNSLAGHWRVVDGHVFTDDRVHTSVCTCPGTSGGYNADLIANAPDDLTWLIATVRDLRRTLQLMFAATEAREARDKGEVLSQDWVTRVMRDNAPDDFNG